MAVPRRARAGARDRDTESGRSGKLRWADIDLDREAIRWRSEHEKTGYEHQTPLSAKALAVLKQAWRRSPGIRGRAGAALGEASLEMPVSPSQPRVWWCRAERLAGMERKRRRGWHSLRRKFASDLMDQPLKVLCELGGWKNAKTVLNCYQRPDEGQLRKALEARRGARATEESRLAGIKQREFDPKIP